MNTCIFTGRAAIFIFALKFLLIRKELLPEEEIHFLKSEFPLPEAFLPVNNVLFKQMFLNIADSGYDLFS